MKALYEAMQTYFAATALAAQVNGLWPGLAKQGTALPYLTFGLVSNDPGQTSDSWEERPLLQITVWSEELSPSQALMLADLLKQTFDNAKFAVIGYDLVTFVRVADRLIPDPDTGWEYSADYRLFIGKPK